MAICRFFQQGYCRYGKNCKFEHVSGQSKAGGTQKPNSTQIDVQLLKDDFSKEKPIWPLSCYGPEKNNVCLIQNTDVSPEEARWQFEQERRATGGQSINQYLQFVQNAMNNYQSLVQNVLKDPQGSWTVALNGQSLDSRSTNSQPFGAYSNSFAALGSSTTSVFGNPQNSTSSFGRSAFGNQSVFGAQQSSNSVFGATPSLPQSTSSVFGAPKVSPAFGTPPNATTSAFGQSAFAANNNQQQKSVFGQSTAFGGSNATNSSVFGQQTPVFGSSTANTPQQSVFGQPAPSTHQPASNTFGVHQQPASAFGNNIPSQPLPSFMLPVSATNPPSNTATGSSDTAESAFKMPKFVFGKIPDIEPSVDLRG